MKKEREMIPSGIRTLAFPAFAVTAFGLGLGGLQGEILVNLDSTSLPEGPLETWLNSGTLDGDFTSAGSQTPTISIVDGVKAVQFVPGVANTHYVGPVAPESVVFNSSRTIEAWVHNPSPQEEETVFAWGRRGGPDGTNVSFGHGTHATWGAVGHWGAPDIGWEGRDTYNEWSYIVYTYDSETFTTRVYTDGVLSNFEELPAPLDTFAEDSNVNPLPFRVARQSNADGTVSDVGVGQINIARIRVHDSVLPEEDVLANYDLEKATFGKDDTDNDGMRDSYEDRFTFLDRNNPDDADLDEDKDGLTNLQESELDTNPGEPDSDGDGVSDGDEVNGSPATNPLVADTDGDGLSDGAEKEAGTDPTLVDTDGDTYPDGQEVLHESNPTSASSVPEFNAPLVDLGSAELATGSLQSWENTGLLGGSFAGSSPAPEVVEINGVKGVQFNGSNQFMTGPSTPGFIAGAAPRTIEAWVYNPAAADEETIFSWGRRGGPEGSNVSFNHGQNAAFGAIGHWGSPDIGWDGNLTVGSWTYVAYSWNPQDLTTRVYRDGTLAAEEILTAPLNTWAVDTAGNPLPFRIASQNEANGTPTGGLRGSLAIAQIRVHDTILSEDQLLQNFEAGATAFGLIDADNDGIPKWFEDQYEFLSDSNPDDGELDRDEDGISNRDEFELKTDLTNPDMDNDGLTDGQERDLGTFILISDSDADGILDGAETDTDPLFADSDGDGFEDGQEVARKSNPASDSSVPDMTANIAMFDLKAEGLPNGPLSAWPNSGALGGSFASSPVPPVVEKIGGIPGVTFNGTDHYFRGPSAPIFISQDSSRTIDAWIYNPTSPDEETIASFGRRGGPDGSNFSFNHGVHPAWGAGGIWGAPDIGWNGNVINAEWTHVAITYDAEAIKTTVYSNGAVANEEQLETPLFTWAENNAASPEPLALLIAAQNLPNGTIESGLRGSMTIGRLRVYDTALTTAEISALYSAEKDAYVAVIPDDVVITGIGITADVLKITWEPAPGATYKVQYTENFNGWTDVATGISNGEFSENIATLGDNRFYRVVPE